MLYEASWTHQILEKKGSGMFWLLSFILSCFYLTLLRLGLEGVFHFLLSQCCFVVTAQVLHPRLGANAVPFGCRGGEPAMRRASSVPVHRGGGCKEGPHHRNLDGFCRLVPVPFSSGFSFPL